MQKQEQCLKLRISERKWQRDLERAKRRNTLRQILSWQCFITTKLSKRGETAGSKIEKRE